ncbi:MAG TPA: response regulator transcription factor [Thauera phenylacetica]|jgi:DNA-binding NarL/FixJ family response regulator|nr:response regulator transcription factor [Thauera phenylacetica]
MTKILIVEDHALVREAMAQRLACLEPELVCLESAGADEALALLEAHGDVDLAIVDLMLPGANGFSLLGVLAKRYPDLPAIVVSAMDDDASVRRALSAGASGFVSKASSGEVLALAVREVLDGGMPTPRASPPGRGGRSLSAAERYGLTSAQNRVAELLATGGSNREIATKLGLTEGTVKVHVTAIYRALGVSSRSRALVLLSRRNKGV